MTLRIRQGSSKSQAHVLLRPCSNGEHDGAREDSPFLMFEGKAEEAMNFYVSLFPGIEITELARYGTGEAGAEGSVKLATVTIGGESVLCTDSFVHHGFTFTPAISFFVSCESEEEVRREYGFSRLFAWVSDRFGVSWQLNFE